MVFEYFQYLRKHMVNRLWFLKHDKHYYKGSAVYESVHSMTKNINKQKPSKN